MGKKIRIKEEKAAALLNSQMVELRQKALPKKQNKRTAPISLPAICNKYPFQRSIDDFKCASCSPFRRSTQLLKYLYCSYAVPAWLLDWLAAEGEVELASAAHERSQSLLMSIIYEMGSGRSPRHILKPYLSKTEMSLFFKSGKPANWQTTVFSHFIYCKALAKGLPKPVGERLVRVSAESRLDKHEIFQFVQNFVGFCAARDVNALAVQDIWDYLRGNKLVGNFSFKGRTLASVLNLVNSWHEALNREARIIRLARNTPDWRTMQSTIENLKIEYKGAPGIPVVWSIFDQQERKQIEVRQLRKYTELVNEGRAMHNCVASYHHRCAQNACYIFSLSISGERKGTIEVCKKMVIQARANCNRRIEGYPLKCLRKWMGKFKLEGEF